MKARKRARKARFIAYVASSIDGRISLTAKKRPDWTSPEDWAFFQKKLGKADAVVVGRNTYEAAKTRLRARNTYVFSSKVTEVVRRGTVTFLNPARIDIADMLKDYKTIAVIGGGRVYQAMLNKGLLDELYVTIEPLVFGRGVEMFKGGSKAHAMKLLSVKRLNAKGTLLLRYQAIR